MKTPEQVLEELEPIHRLGYRGTLFFVDDNFIGNKSAVKPLLPIMREWQRSRGRPFELYTEASVNLANETCSSLATWWMQDSRLSSSASKHHQRKRSSK